MKRIILIILISTVSFCSCSSLSNEESKDIFAIQKVKIEAIQQIKDSLRIEIEKAKKKIDLAAYEVINKADTTLNKKIQDIKHAITEETERELVSQRQRMKEQIKESYIIGFIAIFIGLVSLIFAVLTYRRKSQTNIKQVKDLIHKEFFNNPNIHHIVNNTSNNRQQIGTEYTQQQIIQTIETYISSKQFEKQLEIILKTQVGKLTQLASSTNTASADLSKVLEQPMTKSTCELYAKESDTMQLSSIQNSYQKGKSIYKLILAEPDDNIAQISLCIEYEDAKERILAYDSQYLKPICQVSRLSSQPTSIDVKSVGTAEKKGEEWIVTKQVIVEIK